MLHYVATPLGNSGNYRSCPVTMLITWIELVPHDSGNVLQAGEKVTQNQTYGIGQYGDWRIAAAVPAHAT